MTHSYFKQGVGFAVVALLCMAGCGQQGPRRYDLSGEITHEEAPVPMGEITFDPTEEGVSGGYAAIEDGQYDTTGQGRGHLGGSHTVRIYGFTGYVDPEDPDSGRIPMFPPYETILELPEKTSTMDFEVPGEENG